MLESNSKAVERTLCSPGFLILSSGKDKMIESAACRISPSVCCVDFVVRASCVPSPPPGEPAGASWRRFDHLGCTRDHSDQKRRVFDKLMNCLPGLCIQRGYYWERTWQSIWGTNNHAKDKNKWSYFMDETNVLYCTGDTSRIDKLQFDCVGANWTICPTSYQNVNTFINIIIEIKHIQSYYTDISVLKHSWGMHTSDR